MDQIYFETTDGNLLEGYEMAQIVQAMTGKIISSNDFCFMREFAKSCKGITGETKNISVEKLIQNGHESKAVKIYYINHPGISLSAAREAVLSMKYKEGGVDEN